MGLTTYIGPFLEVPYDFDYYQFENLVSDGRGEAGVGEDKRILIPNQKLAGIDRKMVVDPTGEQQVSKLSVLATVVESDKFSQLIEPVTIHCNNKGIEFEFYWGVVPCWS